VAYLLRPEGWAKVVTGASETVSVEHEARTSHQENQHASRLRRQMEAAVEELKDLRQRHRGEIAAIKAENTDLRRKLGESRNRVREAEASAERARADLVEARESGVAAIAQLESEARRLRARIEELDSELTAARRAAPGGLRGNAFERGRQCLHGHPPQAVRCQRDHPRTDGIGKGTDGHFDIVRRRDRRVVPALTHDEAASASARETSSMASDRPHQRQVTDSMTSWSVVDSST
jgi:chaperonin cofactor prefoldin